MTDFLEVTELAGDEISKEQLDRMCERYYWALPYCEGKDVVEVACGSGQGLGLLLGKAKSVVGGDYSEKMLEIPEKYYDGRVELKAFDAQEMPYEGSSKDVIIIFEALYYIPSAEKFVSECKRVLRKGGLLLIVNANKDLYDFNPSPHSFVYHGVLELNSLLRTAGFESEFFGGSPIGEAGLKQKILRPIKSMAVSLGLMPKTMEGKKRLKKLVFGGLIKMPPEVKEGMADYSAPVGIAADESNQQHKVIYCKAKLGS